METPFVHGSSDDVVCDIVTTISGGIDRTNRTIERENSAFAKKKLIQKLIQEIICERMS